MQSRLDVVDGCVASMRSGLPWPVIAEMGIERDVGNSECETEMGRSADRFLGWKTTTSAAGRRCAS
jgi:hypothetical protein